MSIFYPLVDVSIRLTPLLSFVLNACGKIYIHFILFFCFKIQIQICCHFTTRNHKVLLDYV